MTEAELIELEDYCKSMKVTARWPSVPGESERAQLAHDMLRQSFEELFRLARIGLKLEAMGE